MFQKKKKRGLISPLTSLQRHKLYLFRFHPPLDIYADDGLVIGFDQRPRGTGLKQQARKRREKKKGPLAPLCRMGKKEKRRKKGRTESHLYYTAVYCKAVCNSVLAVLWTPCPTAGGNCFNGVDSNPSSTLRERTRAAAVLGLWLDPHSACPFAPRGLN